MPTTIFVIFHPILFWLFNSNLALIKNLNWNLFKDERVQTMRVAPFGKWMLSRLNFNKFLWDALIDAPAEICLKGIENGISLILTGRIYIKIQKKWQILVYWYFAKKQWESEIGKFWSVKICLKHVKCSKKHEKLLDIKTFDKTSIWILWAVVDFRL